MEFHEVCTYLLSGKYLSYNETWFLRFFFLLMFVFQQFHFQVKLLKGQLKNLLCAFNNLSGNWKDLPDCGLQSNIYIYKRRTTKNVKSASFKRTVTYTRAYYWKAYHIKRTATYKAKIKNVSRETEFTVFHRIHNENTSRFLFNVSRSISCHFTYNQIFSSILRYTISNVCERKFLNGSNLKS